jgi:N-acetylmuramoyl-L-alanine amidase
MTLIETPSPNFDARTAPPSMIVLHYTGMQTGEAALSRLCDAEAKVSAHYLVEEDGRVFRMVAEERRAWHAGVSTWRGRKGVNGVSIGIEIVNPGHEWGYREFPGGQVEAVIELISDIRSRWEVEDRDIVGHSDVAPDRKEDPGERFPWKRLAEAGHGLWAEPQAAPGAPVGEGEEGAAVFALQAGLTRLGYDLPPTGLFDAPTAAVVRAFQRHWRQDRVDGIADGETRARLIALLRLAG